MRLRPLTAGLLLACTAVALAGCGKAGRPIAPPDSVYPRQYPDPDLSKSRAMAPEWDKEDLEQAKPQGVPKQPKAIYIDPSVGQPAGTQKAPMNGPRGTTTVTGDPLLQGLGGPGNMDQALPPVQPSLPESPDATQ